MRAAAARRRLYGEGMLDESDIDWEGRHPATRWAFSLILFVMFLVVLHHGLMFGDGMDPGDGSGMAPGMGPGGNATAGSGGSGGSGTSSGGADAGAAAAAQLAAGGFMLFLLWIVFKALLVALPLCTAMRIAVLNQQRALAIEQAYGLELGGSPYSEERRLFVMGQLLRAGARQQQAQAQQREQVADEV